MEKGLEKVAIIIGLIVLLGLLFTLPVMWLWNWLMPDLFGLSTITFWQAFGLSILARILFQPSGKS